MHYLINFFESLQFVHESSQLEFSASNEQIIVTQNIDSFLFYLTKTSQSLYTSNLCKEIYLPTNDDYADLTLSKTNEFSNYFLLKPQQKPMAQLSQSHDLEKFSSQLEYKLTQYPHLSYLYLNFKLDTHSHSSNDYFPKKKKI